jgi:phage FluMu protein Com
MKPVNEKPSRNEDEYFVKYDAELVKDLRAKADAEREKAERAQHLMRCPRCGASLNEVQYENAIVDVCPDCKGMWLDASEAAIISHTFKAKGSGRSFIDDLTDLFSTSRRK